MADQGGAAAHHRQARHGFLDRISTTLNLTGQQQQEAKTIFKSEREAARPTRQELFTEKKAVREAIQSGKSTAEVQQLAAKEGADLGKLAGMRAEAFAKFYAQLTPDQQQKLVAVHRQRHQKS